MGPVREKKNDTSPALGGLSMLREQILRALIGASVIGMLPLTSFGTSATDGASNVQAPVLDKLDPALMEAMDRDGKAGLIVVLRERADTSGAAALPTKEDKGSYVFQTLRAHADRSQSGLRAYLASQGMQYRAYYIANAIYLEAGRDVMLAVAARPEVERVKLNRRFEAIEPRIRPGASSVVPHSVEWNIRQIRADQVWSQFGVTGEGAVVSVGDTGVQWDHPALKNAYRGWNGSSVD